MAQKMFKTVHEEVENTFSWHVEQAERHLTAAIKLLYGPAKFDRPEKFKAKLRAVHKTMTKIKAEEAKSGLSRRF